MVNDRVVDCDHGALSPIEPAKAIASRGRLPKAARRTRKRARSAMASSSKRPKLKQTRKMATMAGARRSRISPSSGWARNGAVLLGVSFFIKN